MVQSCRTRSGTIDWDDEAEEDFLKNRQRTERPRPPRAKNVSFARQRRSPGFSLGIHGRGSRRSTFKCLNRGKIRAAASLVTGAAKPNQP